MPIYHLSTNMCAAHRKKVLGEIRKRLDNTERILCISTQLIEAGVDIDFGSVIRFHSGAGLHCSSGRKVQSQWTLES